MRFQMRSIRVVRAAWLFLLALACPALPGCGVDPPPPPYGRESLLWLPGSRAQVWAVAPALNLSGQPDVDPLLQADLLYEQLQQVKGLTVIPVNRVVDVFVAMRIDRVESEQQAAIVCRMLGADALVVPTVTAFHPYNPPRFGASLSWFPADTSAAAVDVNPRELAREASPPPMAGMPTSTGFVQVVGIYDAANGTVRDAALAYAAGRNDPGGPMGAREYFASMDRFIGFVYFDLTRKLLERPQLSRS